MWDNSCFQADCLSRDEALAELNQRVKEEHLASLTRSEHEWQ